MARKSKITAIHLPRPNKKDAILVKRQTAGFSKNDVFQSGEYRMYWDVSQWLVDLLVNMNDERIKRG